ncbi:hypothetical protein [Streptomyces sp. NBC_00158]|uniref:hypothetical protein n=1 Tax=Streptomyces sp. NBC_00158 TaxID=2903627 RepID=UPI0032507EB3
MSAKFDVLECQMLDERPDGRLVCLRAPVWVGKIEGQRTDIVATDLMWLKRTSQPSTPTATSTTAS